MRSMTPSHLLYVHDGMSLEDYKAKYGRLHIPTIHLPRRKIYIPKENMEMLLIKHEIDAEIA